MKKIHLDSLWYDNIYLHQYLVPGKYYHIFLKTFGTLARTANICCKDRESKKCVCVCGGGGGLIGALTKNNFSNTLYL
jgi:hypothetical protein